MGQAEQDFWATLMQEKKEVEERERKRQEVLMPKKQPSPIPEEEGAEAATLDEGEEEKVCQALLF